MSFICGNSLHAFRLPAFPCFVLLEKADKRLFQAGGLLALHQFGGGADGEHAAAVHQRDAVTALGFVHKVGGNKDGDALLARELQQILPKHIAGGGIDAGSRLVEYQHFGAVQAGGGQLQALAHAQRQGGGQAVGVFGKLELAQHAVDGGGGLGDAVETGVQHQILAHAELFIE